MQILERWPVSQRFPGGLICIVSLPYFTDVCKIVIDLARLISAFAPAAYGEPGQGLSFFNALLDAGEWSEPWTLPLPKSRETNILLALRGIANGFQVPDSQASTLDWAQAVCAWNDWNI